MFVLGVEPLDEKVLQPLLQGSIAPQVFMLFIYLFIIINIITF
jgi:hypothetical protein